MCRPAVFSLPLAPVPFRQPGIAAVLAFLLSLASPPPAAQAQTKPIDAQSSFADWQTACNRLPSNRKLRTQLPPSELLPLASFAPLGQLLDQFISAARQSDLGQPASWVDKAPNPAEFFDPKRAYFARPPIPFQPFAQKLVLPPGTEIFVHGDLHGDIHSLIGCLDELNRKKYLDGFTIARTNFHMMFLGDYTDRGNFGTEVLYTILRLKLANPNRVWLARGNHEDLQLIARYGFVGEGQAKYGNSFDVFKIARIYDFLPTVIYLGNGSDFLQCNHGGMEPGFDPRPLLASAGPVRFQLLGALKQKSTLAAFPNLLARSDNTARRTAEGSFLDFIPESATSPSVLGFMWNDFSVIPGEPEFAIDAGRAFVYGQHITSALLKNFSTQKSRLRAVFRAHQHSSVLNPMMRRLIASRGLFRHWQTNDLPSLADSAPASLQRVLDQSESRPIPEGSVWTFNVSPDSYYGAGCGYEFDTWGILKLESQFSDWRIHVHNKSVPR